MPGCYVCGRPFTYGETYHIVRIGGDAATDADLCEKCFQDQLAYEISDVRAVGMSDVWDVVAGHEDESEYEPDLTFVDRD